MNHNLHSRYIAFNGVRKIAMGSFAEVAVEVKQLVDSNRHGAILVFNADTSDLLEIDTRGSVADVAQRYAPAQPQEGIALPEDGTPPEGVVLSEGVALPETAEVARPRGRPRLGVVAREVTLLPRHWEWLNTQPGGASVALRKLVEEARRSHAPRDMARKSRDAAYKFMSPIASGLESFEEAARALFAGDRARFVTLLAQWPVDIREHALALAQASFAMPTALPQA